MVFFTRYISLLFFSYFWFLATSVRSQTCKGSLGDPIVNITFGSGTTTAQIPTIAPGASTTYTYVIQNCPNDGFYTVTNTLNATSGYTCFGDDWYHPTEDHTPNDVNGRFVAYNTNHSTGMMYQQTINGLCPNTTYEFAAWIANVVKIGVCGISALHPDIKFQIEDLNGNVLGTYLTGVIQPSPTFTWKQYGLTFKTPPNLNQVVLKIINTAGGCGNDLILDDITFRPCGPTITTTSSAATICAGQTTTILGTVSEGYDDAVYQWQQTNNNTDWTDIVGATSLTYNITNALAGTKYRLVVAANGNINNPNCRIASTPDVLVISTISEPIIPPVMSEVCVGTLIDLVDFMSNPTATYNWEIDNITLGLSQASGTGQVPRFTASAVGTINFKVTATSSGCTSNSKTFSIKINPKPTVSLTASQPIVCEGNSVVLTALATGGTPNYTFDWNNNLLPTTTQTIEPDTTTTYAVTTTDSRGCTATSTVKIVVNAPPKILNLVKTDVKCHAATTGSITATASGAGMLQYSKDGIVFQNSNTFNDLAAGVYTITVKDTNGCSSQKAIIINQPSDLKLNVITKNTTCFQTTDGAVSVNTTGGTMPYSYRWSDGTSQNASITDRPAGTYSLAVTDANGCTQTTSATISKPISISLTTTTTHLTCNGDKTGKIDLTINSKVAVKSIRWNNGAITEDISNLAAGLYTVTVVDANDCSVSDTITIKEPSKITLSVAAVDLTCNGGDNGKITASANGGVGGLLYAICKGSNCTNFGLGQSNGTFSQLLQGIYSIRATDANGCIAMVKNIKIVQPTVATYSISSNSPLCVGSILNLTATNANPSTTFSWTGPNGFSSNQPNPTRANATPDMSGIYTFVVKDADGCTSSSKLEIIINTLPKITTSPDQTICSGSQALLKATASGGLSPYVFEWNNNLPNSTSQTVSPSSTTDYIVVVSDKNNCKASDTIRVNVRPLPQVFSLIQPTKNIYCAGGAGLPVSLSGSESGVLYELIKNNISTGQVIVGTGSPISFGAQYEGNYKTRATSRSNPACVVEMSGAVSFSELPPIFATFSYPLNIVCFGSSSTVEAIVSGGSGSYTYLWQDGSTQNPATFVPSASYTYIFFKVTDSEGCQATAQIDLNRADSLRLDLSVSKSVICTNEPVTISASASGSSGAFRYEWEDGSTNINRTIQPSTTGVYAIKVIDTKWNCIANKSVEIKVSPSPKVFNISGGGSFCSSTGEVLIGLSGSEIGVNYQLKLDGNDFGGTKVGTGSALDFGKQTTIGTYTIVATSTAALACAETMVGNVVIIANQQPQITTNAQPNITCEGQAINLSTTPSANGAYLWTGPNGFTSTSPTPVISNATMANSGVYNVVFIDENGCKQTGTTTAIITAKPVAKITANSPICQGQTLRLAAADAGTGTTYSWSGPNGFAILYQQNLIIQNITSQQSGIYQLTVSRDGCTNSRSIDVVVNQKPAIKITTNSPTCEGETLNLFTTNSGVNATYLWSGPLGFLSTTQNPSTIGSLASSGKYVVVVSQNGCVSSDSVRAFVRPRPIITIPEVSPMCEGQFLTINANTDPSATSYSWVGPNGFISPEQNAKIESVTTNTSGIYQLTASLDGCSTLAETPITINPKPKAIATASTPTCEGSTIMVSASDAGIGAKYRWTGPDGYSSVTPNNVFNNATPNMAGIYRLEVTVGQCTNTDTTQVVVYPKPTLNIISTICATNLKTYSILITATGGQITSSAGIIKNNGGNSFTISNISSENSTVTIVATTPEGCQVTEVVTAPNCSCPKITTPVSNGDKTICKGQTIPTLTVNVPINETVDWYDTALGGNLLLENTTSYTPAQAGTYYAQTRNKITDCISESRVAVELIIQNCQCLGIAPIVIPESQNVCFGDTLKTLRGFVDAGITVNWYDQNNNLLKANSLTYKPTTAGVFFAEAVVVATGCKSNVRTSSTTAISALPAFKAIVSKGSCGNNNVVNADAKIQLVDIQNSQKYDFNLGKTYTGNKTAATATTIPTDGVIVNNLANPDSVVYYTIRVFGQSGCSKDTTVKLSRQNCQCLGIAPIVIPESQNVCFGDTLKTLRGFVDTGITVNWYDQNNNLLKANSLTYKPTTAGVFFAEAVVVATGCKSNVRTSSTTAISSLPAFKAIVSKGSCGNNNVVNADAKIQLVDIQNSQKYDFNLGKTYTGNKTAATATTIPTDGVIVNNLANPDSVVYYTIRVFGQSGCSKDTTVKLSRQTCQCLGIAPIVIPESQNVCFGDTLKTLRGFVDAGITVNWYDQNNNLLKANSLTYKPTTAGVFFAEAVVVATGCKSNVRTSSTTAISSLPAFKAIVSKGSCGNNNVVTADAKIQLVDIQNSQKYDFNLGKTYTGNKTAATATTIPTDGVVVNNLANPDSVVYYTIRVFGQSGCSKDTTVKLNRQTCQCLGIAPIVIPESQNVCFGDTLKTLSGFVDTGITVNWYDQNNNLLKANSLTYKPTTAGVFFAEAVVVATGCKSNVRTSSTTAISSLPAFKAIVSKGTCGNNNVVTADAKIQLVDIQNSQKYDFNLGKTYTGNKTAATATTIPTDGVIVNNLPNPDSVVYYTIRVFGQSGCSKDTTVKLNRQNCVECKSIPFNINVATTSCNGIKSQNDAMLKIEKLNINTRYDYSLGDTYIGLAVFQTARSIPTDSILARNLANPNQFQTYTVRIFEESGCFTDKSVILLAAQCGCLPVPVAVIPVSYVICKDEKIPTLNAYAADKGVRINWYSSPSGGTPVAENANTYTPTGFGVFYVEGIVEKTGCVSTVRTQASLIQINRPIFTVIAKPTTCFGDSARRDGQLVVNGTDIGSFDYSVGDKYTGNGSYNSLNLIAPDGIIATNLPNQNQTYTVRVFNRCGFSSDYTVKTNKTTCICGPLPCFQLQTQRKPKK